jgi:hypothetical protein
MYLLGMGYMLQYSLNLLDLIYQLRMVLVLMHQQDRKNLLGMVLVQ